MPPRSPAKLAWQIMGLQRLVRDEQAYNPNIGGVLHILDSRGNCAFMSGYNKNSAGNPSFGGPTFCSKMFMRDASLIWGSKNSVSC